MLYYLKLLVIFRRSLCRCSHTSHANNDMLWQWLPILLPNCVGCKDVGCPCWFEWSQVIDPVVECRNLAQLLHVFHPNNEAIPCAEIFSNCLKDIACNYGFARSHIVLAIDDVEIAFSHFLEILWLVVQLWHDVDHLLCVLSGMFMRYVLDPPCPSLQTLGLSMHPMRSQASSHRAPSSAAGH